MINPARVTQQAAESCIVLHATPQPCLYTTLQSSAQPKIRLKTSTVVFPSVHDGQGTWIGLYELAELFDAS
jgi:hypothetical protein